MIKEKFNLVFFPNDHKTDHFKALDGLRGIAVLIVILAHSSNENLFFHENLNFKLFGKTGVYLFFVLSAYLLDRQIALAYIHENAGKNYWKNYFLRRVLRIYPLFFVALVCHGLFTLFGIETVIDKLTDIPGHLFLLIGENIFWSIPVEFKYYLISPFIMFLCHKYFKWNQVKIILLLSFLVLTAIVIELNFELSRISTFKYFPVFLVGTFISIYEVINKPTLMRVPTIRLINIIGIVAVIGLSITVPFYFKNIFGFNIDVQSSLYFLPYAIIWGLILIAAKYGKGVLIYILELKILRFVGTISFSVYLFHMLFLKLILQASVTSDYKIYIFFILTLIFSSLTYVLIERPLSKIRLKSKSSLEKKYL